MIYILAGIVGICALICLCGLLEKLLDMLDPPAEAAHRSHEIERNRQHKKVVPTYRGMKTERMI